MLEPEQRTHPRRAADARNSEGFAAQILRAFDVGSRNQIVGVVTGKSAHHLEIVAGGYSGESGAATGAADVHVAGCESRYQGRRAAQIDRLDVDAKLGEQAVFLCDPERADAGIQRGIPDDELNWSRGGIGKSAVGNSDKNGNDESRHPVHRGPLVTIGFYFTPYSALIQSKYPLLSSSRTMESSISSSSLTSPTFGFRVCRKRCMLRNPEIDGMGFFSSLLSKSCNVSSATMGSVMLRRLVRTLNTACLLMGLSTKICASPMALRNARRKSLWL